MVIEIANTDTAKEFIDSIDTFLLDCDGVLWHGNTVLDGISDTLKMLRDKGKKILFVTNNSTKSRKGYAKKFAELGLQASEEEIFGSSYAAAYYMKHQLLFPKSKKVYVVGQKGICEELEDMGITWCGSSEDIENLKDSEWDDVKPDPQIGAVLCGFDIHFNYKKLAKAHCYIRYNENCHFFATNTDTTYPNNGRLFPGTGSIIASITKAVDKEPVVFGKPHKTMLDVIINKYHLNVNRTCMVGDRLDTDIAFGKSGDLKTLLVLTGVSSKEDIFQIKTAEQPDFFAEDLSVLLKGK